MVSVYRDCVLLQPVSQKHSCLTLPLLLNIKGGSKRLWVATKGGSEKLGDKLSKQATAIKNYKVVDKGWKSTVSFVKETKRQFHGIRVRVFVCGGGG